MMKKKPKLMRWDDRMLQLMQYCIAEELADSQKDFCSKIGIHHSAITQIKAGKASFQHEHIYRAAQTWGVNINWLYGIEAEMLRLLETTSPLDLIKEGLRMLQAERGNKRGHKFPEVKQYQKS